MNTIQWIPVADVGSIPAREGRRAYCKDVDIALFHLGNGEYRAVDNRCPHKQGPLADGIVAGESVFCPLHNLNLSLQNGCALNGEGRVKTYPVRVIDGKICVAAGDGA